MDPMQALSANAPLDDALRDSVAEHFATLCIEAGAAIMTVYAGGCKHLRVKADRSPVSEADEVGEAIIIRGLTAGGLDLPIVAEEACAQGDKPRLERRYVLVDPLDGTREFLNRNGEFTVNVALIDAGQPVAGAVYAPALGRLWFAGRNAFACDVAPGAPLPPAEERTLLRTRACPATDMVALASRSHSDAETEAFLAKLPIGDRRAAGSSLKFCVLADGTADVYPRFGPTMEWDTAAGDAVLRAAGGVVLQPDGQAFGYGKPEYRNGPFVAWADPNAASPRV